ncbi:MAG: DUF3429 domain-containing protein, partial [Bosea sp. (in: a-proteobacteria)]
MSETRPPLVPLALGVAGLIPFITLSAATLLDASLPVIGTGEAARSALTIYAIAILSFLGGVRWGIALGAEDQGKAARDYVLAVIPALIGWASFGLEEPAELWTLCAVFIALGLLDYGL